MAMTPNDIKQALDERGLTYDDVARRARPKPLSRTTIYKNVHQMAGAKSARARRLIANAIGRTLDEVFGSAA